MTASADVSRLLNKVAKLPDARLDRFYCYAWSGDPRYWDSGLREPYYLMYPSIYTQPPPLRPWAYGACANAVAHPDHP
jgi:hypothetical protein